MGICIKFNMLYRMHINMQMYIVKNIDFVHFAINSIAYF